MLTARFRFHPHGLAIALVAVACAEPDIQGPSSAVPDDVGAAGAVIPSGASGWAQVGGSPSQVAGGGGTAGVRALLGGSGGGTGAGGNAGAAGSAPALLGGGVVINELMPNEPGSDTTARLGFIELRAEPGTVLDGATIELVNGADGVVYDSVALAGVVAADGYFVVGEADVSPLHQSDGFNVQNGPDSARLLDTDGSVLDAVGYGDFGAGAFFAGETSACGLAGDGLTLGRKPQPQLIQTDTDDNAADFCEMIPSPGFANAPCAGAPGSGGAPGNGGTSGNGGTPGNGGTSGSGGDGASGGGTAGAGGEGCACAQTAL